MKVSRLGWLAACVLLTFPGLAGEPVTADDELALIQQGLDRATANDCAKAVPILKQAADAPVFGQLTEPQQFVTERVLAGCAYDIRDRRSKAGVAITLGVALTAVFLVTDSFRALILSQVVLSVQLPVTIGLQLWLTSARRGMGPHANRGVGRVLLWSIAAVVIALNLLLLRSVLSS